MSCGGSSMAHQNNERELLVAWRSLSSEGSSIGWRTISIAAMGAVSFRAGRNSPANEESLLVGFSSAIRVPPHEQLPQGSGFSISKTEINDEGKVWVALSKNVDGDLTFFEMMCTDILQSMHDLFGLSEQQLFNAFIERIRSWQEFMRRNSERVLSYDREVGLYGELLFIQLLIDQGISSSAVCNAWEGPRGRLHDFKLGAGAVEVKTTASLDGFIARIGGLDQLDSTLISPIFIAGVKVVLVADGRTLPQLVDEISDSLINDKNSLKEFECNLIRAGYLSLYSSSYTRRYSASTLNMFHVTSEFPCLTRRNVAREIRSAHYDIDLDLLRAQSIEVSTALKHLEVI
jgi:hypothetical protein